MDAKDEHTVVKTLENGFIQAVDWSQKNARILKEAQHVVNDGAIDDNINYEFTKRYRDSNYILYSMNKRKRYVVHAKYTIYIVYKDSVKSDIYHPIS